MNKLNKNTKIALAVLIIPVSWLLFPFFTYGGEQGDFSHILPLIIFTSHLLISVLFKSGKLIILSFMSPVFVLALCYSIMPVINYVSKKPTMITCSYHKKATSLDSTKSVFIEYSDDDCDWVGFYEYSFDINNFVTEKLIATFGNPILKK